MKRVNAVFIALFLLGAIACKKDPLPYTNIYNNGWYYNGGDADVNANDHIVVDFDIENNLNVDGGAEIIAETSIGGDLNLNDNGKVVIDIPWEHDTVYVNGNVNINDSLIVLDGVLRINGNLNINATGIVNVSDPAALWVEGDINNSGELYGYRNVRVDGTHHQNGGSTTTQAPLY